MRPLLTALLLLTLCLPARAEEFPINGVAALDILPGHAVPGGHMLAARIRLKPGWKTYWREPGGNGIPPRFTWAGSDNLGAVRFHWPAPKVFVEGGLRIIGYKSELVLPIEITPRDPARPVHLRGEVEFGVCEDVCVPVTARFALATDPDQRIRDRAIDAALASQPRQVRAGSATCAIAPMDGGFALTAEVALPRVHDAQFVVVEYPDQDVWVEPAPTQAGGGRLTTTARLHALGKAPLIIDRSRLRLTVLGGAPALEISGCPAG